MSDDDVELLLQRVRAIRARCYNPSAISYKSYGAKGVTMSPEWKSSNTAFVKDVINLPGFNISKLRGRTLQLDKDQLVKGNKVYSKQTCVWLDRKENIKVMPNHMRWTYAYCLTTDSLYKYYRATSFMERFPSLSKTSISEITNGKRAKLWSQGWTFWPAGESRTLKYYMLVSSDYTIRSDKLDVLAKRAGISTTRMYTASREDDKHCPIKGKEVKRCLLDTSNIEKRLGATCTVINPV